MHLHILGVCGTFMAGIAQIACELGHSVSGSDSATYPPMSTLLESLGADVRDGYDYRNIPESTDLCIIGNAMTRGNPEVEYILDNGLAFMSGPEWLHRHVLQDRHVIAVAGTHGKTTTTSMVCRILDAAGRRCGFLVGGVPGDFDVSARLGEAPWFVIEADEYDTAFFDKRSKFVHYHPKICLLNNLEFDHADIFADIGEIQTQVHHLVRTIPSTGTVVVNADDANIGQALSRGCWSRVSRFSPRGDAAEPCWRLGAHRRDFSAFEIVRPDGASIAIDWSLFGAYNARNALAAAATCAAAEVSFEHIAQGLNGFTLPRRRLQLISESRDIRVYEDFAHHPTAISGVLDALESRHPDARIIAVLEPRSNTMQRGVHNAELGDILSRPAACLMLRHPRLAWDPLDLEDRHGRRPCVGFDDVDKLLVELAGILRPGDVVVLMSNGGFQGLPGRLASILNTPGEPSLENAVN